MAVVGPDADLTERILGCAFRVHAVLGCGFLEKVYENALLHELRKSGLAAESQRPIQVHYDGVLVGDYFADILVEGRVILELKAAKSFEGIHIAQTLNYLKASDLRTALLLNFGTRSLEIKRFLL
ncbi:MAG TPA: GxxExxY protein [Geothrix sp.]|nr:GxxExxY protein [Geothrix sp.]